MCLYLVILKRYSDSCLTLKNSFTTRLPFAGSPANATKHKKSTTQMVIFQAVKCNFA